MGGTTTISNSETRAEALKLQSSAYGATVAVVHGTTRIAGNLVDYGDFRAIANTTTQESGGKGGGVRVENTTYTYTANVIMGLCEGPIGGIKHIWRGKAKYQQGRGPWAESLTLFHGYEDVLQPSWSVLSTMAGGTHEINYSGLAIFCVEAYDLGGTAQVENHNFEVNGLAAQALHAECPDAEPSTIVSHWVTHPRYGRGLPSATLGPTTEYRDYCRAAGLLLSPALTEQASAADRIKHLMELTNSAVVVADRKLHIVPLASEPVSRTAAWGTSYAYTPDLAPLFDLTTDQFLKTEDSPPVRVIRKTPADAYNVVKVQFRNRTNDYATDVAVAEDRASVDLYGAKEAPLINADWICDTEVAHAVARIRLQKFMTALREYRFDLPWNFAAILPTNILRITEPEQGLDGVPVRVTRISETEQGFSIEAEDFPNASTAGPVYTLPVQDGFVHGYSAEPGATDVVHVFEAPRTLTDTGLEVWAAIKGGTNWGGAHMWVSLNGTDYKRLTTVWGQSRCGVLTGPVSAGVLPVGSMTGKLLSASADEASGGITLCYVGGTTPEFLAYQTATLTSADAYNLSGLVRGIYASSDDSAHDAGDVFVRCDDALAKSGPLDTNLIGQQVWIKFQSFNKFGLQTQDMADVTAVPYTVSGVWARNSESERNLIKTGDFSRQPVGVTPASWSGGTVVEVTGQPFARALKFNVMEVGEYSNKIEAREGDQFYLGARLMVVDDDCRFGLAFYDSDGVLVQRIHAFSALTYQFNFSNNTLTVTGQGVWVEKNSVITAPAGSAYAIAQIFRRDDRPFTGSDCFAEDLHIYRPAVSGEIGIDQATSVYYYEVTNTVSVASPIIDTSSGSSYPTEVGQINYVEVPFGSRMLVTLSARCRYVNAASGVSASIGGQGEIALQRDTGSSYGTFNFKNQPGASRERIDDLVGANAVGLAPGIYNFRIMAGKLTSSETFEIQNMQLRLEIVKR